MRRVQHPTAAAGYADASYPTATYAPSPSPSPSPYDAMVGYAPAPSRKTFAMAPEPDHARRYSQPSVGSDFFADQDTPVPKEARQHRNSLVDFGFRRAQTDDRRGFQAALEASHGLPTSPETPRNVYGPGSRGRASADSYGFPSTYSTSSSLSPPGFAAYYGGSVESSVSDYSTAGSDIESLSGPAMPRPPPPLMANQTPPARQSMMGQFSSKVSSSTQKKHKCEVCDKRFTRPSSLQTHMYSHTGEKRTLFLFINFPGQIDLGACFAPSSWQT
jgi:hypothetical protein